MFTLTDSEASDLFANIELGWAKPVPAAKFVAVDAYGEAAKEYSFYRFDDQVFCLMYENRIASTTCKEVTGDDLEMFNLTYGEAAA